MQLCGAYVEIIIFPASRYSLFIPLENVRCNFDVKWIESKILSEVAWNEFLSFGS